ncbi:MAG: hypothetical protein OK456_09020, partial [Thaumarchaeota archaeon]|nr:hypothetical protein [Nitrososphaerota archaeon]
MSVGSPGSGLASASFLVEFNANGDLLSYAGQPSCFVVVPKTQVDVYCNISFFAGLSVVAGGGGAYAVYVDGAHGFYLPNAGNGLSSQIQYLADYSATAAGITMSWYTDMAPLVENGISMSPTSIAVSNGFVYVSGGYQPANVDNNICSTGLSLLELLSIASFFVELATAEAVVDA